jgi:hypothetical protein
VYLFLCRCHIHSLKFQLFSRKYCSVTHILITDDGMKLAKLVNLPHGGMCENYGFCERKDSKIYLSRNSRAGTLSYLQRGKLSAINNLTKLCQLKVHVIITILTLHSPCSLLTPTIRRDIEFINIYEAHECVISLAFSDCL